MTKHSSLLDPVPSHTTSKPSTKPGLWKRFVLLCVLCTFISATAHESPSGKKLGPDPLTETERIIHLLQRFTFGATAKDVEAVRDMGIDEWLDQQFQSMESNEILRPALERLDTFSMTRQEVVQKYYVSLDNLSSREQRREREKFRRLPRKQIADWVLHSSVQSSHQLLETWADFFRNHFNVSVDKMMCQYYVSSWERDVIRGFALDSFAKMLKATAHHPAMLVYLDNAVSRRPPTEQELREIERRARRESGSRIIARERVELAKQRGLNENYARELLELHTLGVDNGYTQNDVVQVALALTGWTFQRSADKPIEFEFQSRFHAQDPKVFMGRRIPQERDKPTLEGDWILESLVRSEKTATFLATKICRHFHCDQPNAELVEAVAKVFKESRGDMESVIRALVSHKEFFRRDVYQSKFKRPFEYVASALRVTGAEIDDTVALHQELKALQEPIYYCEEPTGYSDHAEAWQDPGVMVQRWSFAMRLARDEIKGVRIPDTFFDDLHPEIPHVWPEQIAAKILPSGLSRKSQAALARFVKSELEKVLHPEPLLLGADILGMILGSPEFQRQ